MAGDALTLIGRGGTQGPETLRTHATRLERRGVVDAVHVATYREEPVRELRDRLESTDADRTFVLPACIAHSHETIDALPAALSYLDSAVRYCEPIGRSPALTALITEQVSNLLKPEGTTLVCFWRSSATRWSGTWSTPPTTTLATVTQRGPSRS